uniref:Uncharacterized protein n=1 Tax=Candidatus Kentrum eta TaxID=2126337 RepID=A0A450V098_9GAMM|nr:MAG: hypothetical protein BECKH772A_GA0070896_1001926 [Candidatus Kentron sp. H]VFJ91417.1 MAG: hypothetical protein BECKH772B_GA0070898_1001726 [Candidatus Kentron sp. H]VFJ98116.1 MAG: hypothetical protein BECKH772C_GA0070978_1001826 [Candidatus Kentron sp. H]
MERKESEPTTPKQNQPDIQLTEYRGCFFAFDYKIEENFRLLQWIEKYFQQEGLGIKVIAPIREMSDLNIQRSLRQQLEQVHFGIAEIPNNNHNVLYEAGLPHGMGKPLILLQRQDSKAPVPFVSLRLRGSINAPQRHEDSVNHKGRRRKGDRGAPGCPAMAWVSAAAAAGYPAMAGISEAVASGYPAVAWVLSDG